jgi:CBS domain-containing protein
MKVSHFMTGYAPTCPDDSSIAEVEKLLLTTDRGPFAVVDRGGRVVGILRESDIREAGSRFGRNPDHVLVSEAMRKDVRACLATDDVDVALSRMRSIKLSRLPVVDASGKLIGAVSIVDPQLEEGGGFLEGAGEGLGAVPEPTVVGHRSPSYVDGSAQVVQTHLAVSPLQGDPKQGKRR